MARMLPESQTLWIFSSMTFMTLNPSNKFEWKVWGWDAGDIVALNE